MFGSASVDSGLEFGSNSLNAQFGIITMSVGTDIVHVEQSRTRVDILDESSYLYYYTIGYSKDTD